VAESAVTPISRILRKFKLDELPQLINVARRVMITLGPRPCLVNQQELVLLREAKGIFDLRPGITGLPQVLGIDMSDPDKLVELEVRMLDERTKFEYFHYVILTAFGRCIVDRTFKKQSEK